MTVALALALAVITACDGAGSALGDNPDAMAGDGGAVDDDVGFDCETELPATSDLSQTRVLSEPARRAMPPATASRDEDALVVWREVADQENVLRYSLVSKLCVGATREIDDALSGARRPQVAATESGWVIAYQVDGGDGLSAVRAVWLDRVGEVVAGPETVSSSGVNAAIPSVAAWGDDVAFAWTDSQAHWFARRGPVEEVAAQLVGTTLVAPGLINTPHIAVSPSGDLYLAYADGGPESYNRDVLVTTRPIGGSFGAPVNVSRTPGLMSVEIDLAMEDDGALDVVWVEQDGDIVETFEVRSATRAPGGALSSAAVYEKQGGATYQPSAAPGRAAAWHLGGISAGKLYFTDGPHSPTQVATSTFGGGVALARLPAGAFLLAFVEPTSPPRLHIGALR